MRRQSLPTLILALSSVASAADYAPAIQWVASTGGSGSSSAAAAAADAKGNLYIVGGTTSLDFPVTTGAAQRSAGASTLVRVDLPSGNAVRLYPASLASITAPVAASASPGTLIAAAQNQIFKSTDAGSTFTPVFRFPSGFSVFSLTIDPVNSNTFYAGTLSNGIYKSSDGGITWVAIDNGIPLLQGGINVGGIWIEPGSPNVVFAATGSGLARSPDGGVTWKMVGAGNSYSTYLAFDPFQSGSMYLAFGSGLSRSKDDGNTFTPVSTLPNQAGFIALVADPQHAESIYAGTTGGLYQSTDAGVTWNLKIPGSTTVLAVDPGSSALYANGPAGILKSTDGFSTTSLVGPNEPSITQMIVAGQNLFAVSVASTDAFAVKLDNNGNIVYSTYFGGSGNDSAAAVAVGADGSLYVAGSTNSSDLPGTAGAYLSKLPSPSASSSFILKLNPDGTLAWSTYFNSVTVVSIAVDSTGSPYIGGTTSGSLATTTGAYQTAFQRKETCTEFIGCFPGPASAFVTKFNPAGTALTYSTYVSADNQKNLLQVAQAMVVDASGNVWIGAGNTSQVNAGVGPGVSILELNSSGSAVLASAVQAGLGSIAAIALDSNANVYIAGAIHRGLPFFPRPRELTSGLRNLLFRTCPRSRNPAEGWTPSLQSLTPAWPTFWLPRFWAVNCWRPRAAWLSTLRAR